MQVQNRTGRLHTKVVLTHQAVAENNVSSSAPLGSMDTNFVPIDYIYHVAALVPFSSPSVCQRTSQFGILGLSVKLPLAVFQFH